MVVTPLGTHGFRDVTGYKPSFLHGIDIVSRGLKDGVVGHEVSGSNVSVISLNVNSGTVRSMSSEEEVTGVRKAMGRI